VVRRWMKERIAPYHFLVVKDHTWACSSVG
jgi:hypothetical protein